MKENVVKLTKACPVLLSKDVRRTVEFYVEKLGFKFATHYDKIDNFATIYRNEIEFIIVQTIFGQVESNTQRYGNGFDAYVVPDTVQCIDILYHEFLEKEVKIVSKPEKKDYGSYEFVIEDIDGRLIGFGLIYNEDTYFSNSNLRE